MPDLDYLRIIKWILIVLLAGFIGQFGKSLAKHLMEKARLKRKVSFPETTGTIPVRGGSHIEKVPDTQESSPSTLSPEEKAKQEKKLAKTRVKQEKKEAKALEKEAKK